MNRSMLRHMGRSATWDPYSADIVTWDSVNCVPTTTEMYFAVPYELVDGNIEARKHSAADYRNRPTEELRKLMTRWFLWADQDGIDCSGEFGLFGLWGDAAVWNDSTLYATLFDSLGNHGIKREPLVVFPKNLVCDCGCHGRHTFDSCWVVIVYFFHVA